MILYFDCIRLDTSPEIVTGTGDDVSHPGSLNLANTTVTDDLIDIAVYATMALNRFKRGDADPATLGAVEI